MDWERAILKSPRSNPIKASTHLIVWDIASNDVIGATEVDDPDTRDFGHGWGVLTVVASPDGRYFASGGFIDGSIQIYDVASIQEVLYFTNWRNIQSLAFSPDGSLILGSDTAGNLLIWGGHNGSLLLQQQAHTSSIHEFVFNPDGTILATAGNNVVITWGIRGSQE